jgi:predicted TPR repeat methyltransferase
MAVQDPAALLQQAVQLHQQGKLDAAQALYRQVLAVAPRQFDALHLLGVIARQQGKPERAAALIADALAVDPHQARAHCNLGAALQDLNRPADALASYDAALRLDPAYALAWDNRGNALRRLARPAEALDSHERALALQPANAGAWRHRAIVLNDLGRPLDAAASAERALAIQAGDADAALALGHALQALDRQDAAIAAYDRALARRPDGADIWCARGAALKKAGDLAAALASYDRALALRPAYALAAHYRANALRALGRRDAALAGYRQALALGADATEIGFALAALGAAPAPAGAPPDYVRTLFDQYAGHFDAHLVDVLGYRTPALLDNLIRRHLAPGTPPFGTALDLGCGTGLCGPLLRPLARHLSGVDLSPRMLERARALGIYDDLACADIVPWLTARADKTDLIVAADVLVYFGDLAPLFDAARRVLTADGLFAFSCEALEHMDEATAADQARGHAVTLSNRFAHTIDYIARSADGAGFTLMDMDDAPLRRDHDRDVPGHLVLMRVA